jgi:hypothetical protein
MADGTKPASELEAEARAINATDWQPPAARPAAQNRQREAGLEAGSRSARDVGLGKGAGQLMRCEAFHSDGNLQYSIRASVYVPGEPRSWDDGHAEMGFRAGRCFGTGCLPWRGGLAD